MTVRIGTAMPAVSVRRPVHSVKPLEEETLVGVLIFVLTLTYRLHVHSLLLADREEDEAKLFSVAPSDRTRCNGYKQK